MLKRFSVTILAKVASSLLQLFFLALVARIYPLGDFGTFVLYLSIFQVVFAFSDFGMSSRVFLGFEDQDSKTRFFSFFIVRLVLVLIVLGAVLALTKDNPSNMALALLTVIYSAGESLGDLAVGAFQAEKRSALAAYSLLGRKIITVTPLLLLPAGSALGSSLVFSAVMGWGTYLIFIIRNSDWRFNPRLLFRQNSKYLGLSAAGNLTQLDTSIVGFTLGAASVGYYASALKLFNPLNLLVIALTQVLTPELAQEPNRESRAFIFRKMRNLVFLFASALVLASPFSPWVVVTIYGQAFSNSAPVAIAVCFAAAFTCISQVYLSWHFAEGLSWKLPLSMTISILLGLSLIGILSSQFELIGASVGLVLMQLMSMFVIVLSAEIPKTR